MICRTKILCDICNTEMVFTRKITPPAENSDYYSLIYRCPTRKNEGGCGKIKECIVDSKTQEVIV